MHFQDKLEKLDVDEAVSSCFKDPSEDSDPKTEREDLKAKLQKLVSDYGEVSRKANSGEVKDNNEIEVEKIEMEVSSPKATASNARRSKDEEEVAEDKTPDDANESRVEESDTRDIEEEEEEAKEVNEAEDGREAPKDVETAGDDTKTNSEDLQLTGKLIPLIVL